jgi:beta-phosphoglucomutase
MIDIKACIFDLDGVIVDTARYHFIAWKKLAEKLGIDFTEEDNERLKGVSRMDSLNIILDIGGLTLSENEKEKYAAEKNEIYLSYILKMTPDELLPGVAEFLTGLKKQGIALALGSASKNAMTILGKIGLLYIFDAIVDGTRVSKAKPDPQVFLTGAAMLGVEPSSCVVFEDAIAGIEAAHRAGMKCVGIGSPGLLSDADLIIDGFKNFNPDDLRF